MIFGNRVRLRPVERADLPKFVEWFANPQLRARVALYQPVGRAQEERWFEVHSAPSETQPWAIEARGPAEDLAWQLVGSCAYHALTGGAARANSASLSARRNSGTRVWGPTPRRRS